MQPTPLAQERPWTVSQLTRALKQRIEGEFSGVTVDGEVSNARAASSGHVYFTLKDGGAQVPCVMWRSTAQRLPFRLTDGMQVEARGDVQVYMPHGKYQLVVQRVRESGLGQLLARLEALKRRLGDEGLFDPQRKRPLPFLPRRVGVVTAGTGAALQDVLATLERRFPTRVLLYPCKVQGPGAAETIARGIALLAAVPDVDVIIAGRGGGSIEDLWAFNEEVVVRAIATCDKPVVSAVGHEVDTLLSDLAADLRAATPTAGAEHVVPEMAELRAGLSQQLERLERALRRRLDLARRDLDARRGRITDPRRLVAERQQGLDDGRARLASAMRTRLSKGREQRASLAGRLHNLHPRLKVRAARHDLASLTHRLEAAAAQGLERRRRRLVELTHTLNVLSPAQSLERGYAIVRTADGRVLRRADEAEVGAEVEILLHRGALDATIDGRRERHEFEPAEAEA